MFPRNQNDDATKRFGKRDSVSDLTGTRENSAPTSYRCGPGVIAHSRFVLVVLRLSTGGSTDGRVGEVHVWRHGCRVSRASGLGISEVVG